MRFLCLHGRGTNCQIYKSQLAAVQYQLGDRHEFEFVEGTLPAAPAPEIQLLAAAGEQYFSYFDDASAGSCLAALDDLEQYLDVQGPFDGVIAFSQGTILVGTLLLRLARQKGNWDALKLVIFFSGAAAGNADLLSVGQIEQLRPTEVGQVIKIPTAHIWGCKDRGELDGPLELRELCCAELREEFQHQGGHEIPGSKDQAAVQAVVRIMKRTIWKAERRSLVMGCDE